MGLAGGVHVHRPDPVIHLTLRVVEEIDRRSRKIFHRSFDEELAMTVPAGRQHTRMSVARKHHTAQHSLSRV